MSEIALYTALTKLGLAPDEAKEAATDVASPKDMATKADMKDMATKADIKDMATKADIKDMATKADIKDMATKADIKDMATKADIKDMATKSDILRLESFVKERLAKLETEFKYLRWVLFPLNIAILIKLFL